ncbi:FTR1 family protein [Candidatus Gracilibacteria bacterium]|nr:FTR1 family protein [Candidatus Gracilibacteria bacterium]
MSAALVITLRETLEAALIVGILLAYLKKTQGAKGVRYVWGGVVAGIVLSLVLAWVFGAYLGGFEGQAEELYEGVMMLVAAGLLTWMILWMLKQRRNIKKDLENKASMHLKNSRPWGLFALSFVGVAREGIETVIFLQAALVSSDGAEVLWGGLLGIVLAIVLAFALFKGAVEIPLKKFFTFTSVILILFAAGLVAHGVHELQEAMVVPVIAEHIWDINGILNEKGAFGSFLKGLFGYNGNPNLLEVVAYFLYLMGIAVVWQRLESKD